MKTPYLIAALWAFAAASAEAQEAMDFAEADLDGDGVLSIEEAQAALPDLEIRDMTGDGIFTVFEAEQAVPGLYIDTAPETPVGPAEYAALIQALRHGQS